MGHGDESYGHELPDNRRGKHQATADGFSLSTASTGRLTFTCELAVVFATGLVVTDDTADLLAVLVLGAGASLGVRALLAHV